MPRNPFARRAALLGTFVFVATTSFAQTTASFTGIVTAGSRPAAKVDVTVSSPTLQGTRTAQTNGDGAYSFPALPPGAYIVKFQREGFEPVSRTATLALSQTTRINVAMEPVTVRETMTVAGAAPSVVETPEVSTNLTLRFIERLPVLRNQLATAQFAPGVNSNTLSNGTLYIAGGPGYDNLVLINGVVVTENTRGQLRPLYVEDAIQETTVLSGAISAEYGRFSGGIVSSITKSGGNTPSGSLRDSLSNPSWSAQSPALETREHHLNHVFESTLGGSVVRDRVWFFTAGRWAKNETARQTVPLPNAATSAVSYAEGNDQKRWEAKLTAALAQSHSLAASYFGIHTNGTNARFSNNIYDTASLTRRDDADSLAALHYDGVFASDLLAEAHLSARKFSDRTGGMTTDLIAGTVLLDRSNNNTRFHAPTLCDICDAERRNNDDVVLKLHKLTGRHDLVGGADRFAERRYANNHQSGSDFSLFVTRAQAKNGAIYPVITPTNASGGGTFIRWNPVFAAARFNDLRTDSAFVNDTWTPSTRWSVSLGVRFDRNHAVDADGNVASDDHKFSPRAGVQFDPTGDGRQHFTVSLADYASRIADSIASLNQAAGNAASIDFAWRGPAINDTDLTVSMDDAIARVFAYFNAQQGGTANRANNNLRANGTRTVPGYSAYFDGTLTSPYVREWTAGYSRRLGTNGFVRADYVHRDWRDLYAASVTSQTRRASTPLGINVDLPLVVNTNGLQRRYRAVLLQARWNPSRFDFGAHYTWAKLRGNDDSESASSGAVANSDPSLFYPEFFRYSAAAPSGWLAGDQRHRLRAWAGYEQPLGRSTIGLSLLQSIDSGLPYSIVAPINLTRYTGAPANPGYASIPNGLYYFSGRGALRTAWMRSTDIALRYTLPVIRGEFFAQADVLNILDHDALVDPQRIATTVSTAATTTSLAPFNPATDTPVAGVNYTLAPNFGSALNNLAYQTPRTMRVSVGVRF